MGGPWLDSRCPTRSRYHFPFLPGQRRKNKTENNLWVETSQSKRFNVEKQRKMLKTLFFTSYQQAVLCYFPESNGSAWVAFPLEGKTYKKWMPSFISPFIDFKCEQTSYGIPLWSTWVTCPSPVPSQDFANPHPAGGAVMMERQCCCCAGAAQQCPKHLCVTNTSIDTSAEHCAVRAAVGKTNSSSGRPNTSPN